MTDKIKMKILDDVVICKCGVRYRSQTECVPVDGVKAILTTHPCPGCGRKDNWAILTSDKGERIPSFVETIEETMAWERQRMEFGVVLPEPAKVEKHPDYPGDCYEPDCKTCTDNGHRTWC
jgi:hypothetical protein